MKNTKDTDKNYNIDDLYSNILYHIMIKNYNINKLGKLKNALSSPDDNKEYLASYYEDNNIHESGKPNLFRLNAYLNSFSAKYYANSSKEEYLKIINENEIKQSLSTILLEGTNYRLLTEDQTKSKIYFSDLELIRLIDMIPNKMIEDIERFCISIGAHLLIEAKNSQNYLICSWLIGLTKKGKDNIVGTSSNALYDYCISYAASIKTLLNEKGTSNSDGIKNYLKYELIGQSNLTIRGSMKSMAGKLYEHLILGSALSSLGFNYIKSSIPESEYKNHQNKLLFWLSSTEENDGREKDATILYNSKIINIDIGLIGKGNPEIILDKLTRYRNAVDNKKININKEHTIVIAGEINNGKTIHQAEKESHSDVVVILNNENWLSDLYNDSINFLKFTNNLPNKEQIKQNIDKLDFKKFLTSDITPNN